MRGVWIRIALSDAKVWGEDFPDAHTLLSLVYTKYTKLGWDKTELEDLRVTSLLPVRGDEYGIPYEAEIREGENKEEVAKRKEPGFWRANKGYFRIVRGERLRVSLDRIKSASNLYPDSYAYVIYVNGNIEERIIEERVREFVFWANKELDWGEILLYEGIGGNRSVGSYIKKVQVEDKGPNIDITDEGGLLLSLAAPTDREPEWVKVKRKAVVCEKEGKIVKKWVYAEGSILRKGQFKPKGDVEVCKGKLYGGEEVRKKLFLRPVFMGWENE